MRRVPAICLVLPAAWANAQGPQAPAPPVRPCTNELVLAGESYDLRAAGHGHGLSIDAQRCPEGRWSYLAGGSTFRIADSRWSVGRLGATFRPEGHTAWVLATAGRGRNAAGGFDYGKASGGLAARLGERLHAKAEFEWFDVDVNSGHVGKIGGIVALGTSVWVDLTLVRTLAGDLPTRAAILRLDAVAGATRAFGGYARGRLLPQVDDIAQGERLPDVSSVQAFIGVARRFAWGELIAAADRTRTGPSRRATYSVGLRIPVP